MDDETGGEVSEETTAPVEGSGQGQEDSGTSGNPAWNEILQSLPDSLHSVVRPALEKWDRNYESSIQKVHSQYEPYKPLIENGYDPQTLEYALQVLNTIESDPRKIYDALAEHNGWAVEQGQTDSEENDEVYDPETPVDPRVERAEQLSEAVAQYIMDQHEQQEATQQDEALDQQITSLKQQHGIAEDDTQAERFVMGLMLAGTSAEQAFDEYDSLVQQTATRARPNDSAPSILGSGGGVPSSQIPVSQLRDANARKALVAQMLSQQDQ